MAGTLTNFKSTSRELSLMQSQWASQLQPLLKNPLVNGIFLPNVSLTTGANTIDHRLGRALTGWVITRIRASSSIYDTQDTNPMPDLTLTLQASADAIIDLYVF